MVQSYTEVLAGVKANVFQLLTVPQVNLRSMMLGEERAVEEYT